MLREYVAAGLFGGGFLLAGYGLAGQFTASGTTATASFAALSILGIVGMATAIALYGSRIRRGTTPPKRAHERDASPDQPDPMAVPAGGFRCPDCDGADVVPFFEDENVHRCRDCGRVFEP